MNICMKMLLAKIIFKNYSTCTQKNMQLYSAPRQLKKTESWYWHSLQKAGKVSDSNRKKAKAEKVNPKAYPRLPHLSPCMHLLFCRRNVTLQPTSTEFLIFWSLLLILILNGVTLSPETHGIPGALGSSDVRPTQSFEQSHIRKCHFLNLHCIFQYDFSLQVRRRPKSYKKKN